ncbi:MAG: T9SS type A sorting domain-containing protein [Bacteroidales bacterium]|nr:T9SS type A sorting domain-containing protein [Bacteroidales bacterium]
MKKLFMFVIVLILTGFYAVGQSFTYHPDDKEGMRIFLRQPSGVTGKINAECLGLQLSDTLNWNGSDAWIPKATGFTWKLYEDNYYRIAKIECGDKGVAGQLNGAKWTHLETLHCYDNKLTVIDVSANAYLNHLACDNNPLQSINVTGAGALLTLYCQKTNVTTLDLTTNVKLVSLDCSKNAIADLDVSQCPGLTMLYCNDNQITLLDVNSNPNLSNVRCENNHLTDFKASEIHSLVNLNISDNPLLTSLNCSGNKLSALDISGNTNLVFLNCSNNKIGALDVSEAVDLVELDCSYNLLMELDVSKHAKLTTFYCNNNQISTINVNKAVDLIELDCSHNWLSGLDVSKNTKLTTLYCGTNQILTLEIGNVVNLIDFDCSENSLTRLDVTKNTKLQTLNFATNNIETIDLKQNIELTELNCSDNLLEELRSSIENCPLEYLNCSKNRMLFSQLVLNTDTIMQTFIYSPQKMCFGGVVDYKENIDLTAEYMIVNSITKFHWRIFWKEGKKDKELWVDLSGEDGLFKPIQQDLTGKYLRCRMTNAYFPTFAKDTLEYEITLTGTPERIEEMSTTAYIYPNPTDGKVVIQNVGADVEKIQLFDMSGKMVFETRQTTFDIFHLPTAVYFINIKTSEGVITRKITKK